MSSLASFKVDTILTPLVFPCLPFHVARCRTEKGFIPAAPRFFSQQLEFPARISDRPNCPNNKTFPPIAPPVIFFFFLKFGAMYFSRGFPLPDFHVPQRSFSFLFFFSVRHQRRSSFKVLPSHVPRSITTKARPPFRDFLLDGLRRSPNLPPFANPPYRRWVSAAFSSRLPNFQVLNPPPLGTCPERMMY